ncbi:copper transporter 1-like [Tripterygium wilfordii]|uniref:Copper transport protein n=1 Tax=Tripterygium wilfordii TaxID=458696 RepID=A0A7J7DMJ4_TRIWF|nr:copper transporter 6-like [Tripterygium wilfordii]KAF5747548.1 copper transporter 1-like [Tripterygium wilfordii]
MDGMHDHDMGMGAPPPMGHSMLGRRHMMMHMTFFWGNNAEVLFDGWPGHSSDMYALSLIMVFVLALIVEWLSHCQLIKAGMNRVVAGLVQTMMHAFRVGVSLLVMLAIMSFNGGVFLAAVAGHTVGFLLFGSRVFKKSHNNSPHKTPHSDLPPITC